MDPRLRLVKPNDGSPSAPDEDEAPPTAEELAAAERLRDQLERDAEPLSAALRAAHAPRALDDDALDALLAQAMGDEGTATPAEREAAERLRAELAGEAEVREAAVFRALSLAADPPALRPEVNAALVEAALFRAGRRTTARRLAPVTMAALAGVTALAAGFALIFGQARPPVTGATALIRSRSTQELFDAATPFPRRGEESARIDRIAAARAGDLRANRFAAWGVR